MIEAGVFFFYLALFFPVCKALRSFPAFVFRIPPPELISCFGSCLSPRPGNGQIAVQASLTGQLCSCLRFCIHIKSTGRTKRVIRLSSTWLLVSPYFLTATIEGPIVPPAPWSGQSIAPKGI